MPDVIHTVSFAQNDVYKCSQCRFSGTLSEALTHITINQFTYVPLDETEEDDINEQNWLRLWYG